MILLNKKQLLYQNDFNIITILKNIFKPQLVSNKKRGTDMPPYNIKAIFSIFYKIEIRCVFSPLAVFIFTIYIPALRTETSNCVLCEPETFPKS